MKWWNRQLVRPAAAALVLSLGWGNLAALATSCGTTPGNPSFCSNNYEIVESQIGGVPSNNSNSSNYSFTPGTDDGGSTLGDSAVGNSSSADYQTNSGYNTTYNPDLTFTVNTSFVNLGILSTGSASSGIAQFNVENYTSYGYEVLLIGSTPTNGSHHLTALTTDTSSAAGTEQFGVNMRANSTPVVGADPVPNPAAPPTFSYGVAGDGVTGTYGTTRPYTIPNKFRFNTGETVASAPKSSGQTDYTMSILANINTLTPSGSYSGALTLVVVGTY